jgi:hypothetical protein
MIKLPLFNKLNCTAGYLSTDGTVISGMEEYFVVTDYMKVSPGSTCSYSGLGSVSDIQLGAYYDKNQNFVSTFTLSVGDVDLVIPRDVYFVRFTLNKHSKMNLFNDELEEGSINDISGSNEAGATFTRSKSNNITIGTSSALAQLVIDETYTVSTSVPVYQVSIYYYRATSSGYIYDSFVATPFNEELTEHTFIVPNDSRMAYLRFKFYTPDENHDFKVMLNMGDYVLPYVTPSESDTDDRNTFNFFIYGEAYSSFREDLYNYMKLTLSPNLTLGDLDIIIKLMCYIFGDLTGVAYALKDQLDPDKAEEQYLRHLGSIIGYEWNNALTADQQRESMKLFVDIRKKRGTNWSLQNLISVFGQDRVSYYSSADLRGIRILEGGKDGEPVGTEDVNGLYPGDIMIEIPQFSNILRNAIDNIRLIGTRIMFTYVLYIGPLSMTTHFSGIREIYQWFDPAYWGYDPKIEDFGPLGEDTVIDDVIDWPITHRVENCKSNFKCVIYTAYKEPYERGFVWNEPGNTNYKGYLVDDETLQDEHTMYGYPGQS